MHPRKPPNQVQARRKAELGLGPSEHLQRRMGLVWGLTRRARASKGAGVGALCSPGVRPGKQRNARQRPWTPWPFG